MVKNIFVGNLDFGATEDSLRALFEQDSAIRASHAHQRPRYGQPRSFEFVGMTGSAATERAIAALNGTNCGGRAIKVNEACPGRKRWTWGRRRKPGQQAFARAVPNAPVHRLRKTL